MRFLESERNAQSIAILLQGICYFVTAVALAGAVLVVLGRVEMDITTPSGHYDRALLVEQDREATARFLFTRISEQDVYLTLKTETAGFFTRLCVALMGLVQAVPAGFCFFFLAGLFRNIAEGRVFVARNAAIFFRSGLILVIASLAGPVLEGLVLPWLINRFTEDRILLSLSVNYTALFFGFVLLVAAYVFHYGIYLQDEVDHTV